MCEPGQGLGSLVEWEFRWDKFKSIEEIGNRFCEGRSRLCVLSKKSTPTRAPKRDSPFHGLRSPHKRPALRAISCWWRHLRPMHRNAGRWRPPRKLASALARLWRAGSSRWEGHPQWDISRKSTNGRVQPSAFGATRGGSPRSGPRAAVAVVTDSANQHLAALHGTPSVTLWMGTAPEAGFVPYHPGLTAHVRPGDLACTPCSIYGTSTCSRGDFACRKLSTQDIADAIRRVARTDLDLSAL